MNYPFWDVGIGYGLLMASIAVIHVFVSHFAIGGGMYLVVAEISARKKNDSVMLEYLQKLSKFFVLVTVVFGAVTGVGIWFIIGLLNPTATEVLIHNFVWGWATEWTFFLIEIAAAILYYYGWQRLSVKAHLFIGWVYFGAAWMSLFIINGIITFMLTPGKWLTTGDFWDGFFNPTFWPSLWFRTGICILLAGLYALLVASLYKSGDFKARIIRYNSLWAIIGLVIMVPTLYWYWNAIPSSITTAAHQIMTMPIEAIDLAMWFAGGIFVLIVIFGFILPRWHHFVIAIILMLLGLGTFGGFEWMRESIRKPYVIEKYMYGNGLEVAKTQQYEDEGYLKQIVFRTGNDGADIYRHACQSCHTINGYRPLAPAFNGTDKIFIAGMVKGVSAIKSEMPPFMGTSEEASLIADYIYQRIDKRPLNEVYPLRGVALGKKVFDIRCGKCHVKGGYQDNTESLTGLSDEDYNDLLDNAGDLAEQMPPFTGSNIERQALIKYFKSLSKGGEK
ncbi:MAG: hypothetical protein GXO93_02360 [FCB group bacterium]|nr:hypothetical protein [FCB group bacterium]